MIREDPIQSLGVSENDTKLDIVQAINNEADLPKLPDELIEGVIRRGSKLLITGASKTGKSFLLIELALAVAVGGTWCGMNCTKGKVLYVNLEIQEPQFMHRVYEVMKKTGVKNNEVPSNFHIANLRGEFKDIASLVDAILRTAELQRYDLILIDPTYKVQSGPENNADAITQFCSELDRLVEWHGCTVAYSHHHSKGGQQNKNAEDRASGSGVFARDADAIVDMAELKLDENTLAAAYVDEHPGAVPFRLEFVLRDFVKRDPIEVWFDYPSHTVDTEGVLRANNIKQPGAKSDRRKGSDEAKLSLLEKMLGEYMGGRSQVERKSFLETTPMSKETFKRLIGKSRKFHAISTVNSATIYRVNQK